MDRRHYLQAVATAGVTGVAGCLDGLSETDDGKTVLEPPAQDLSAASHPSYGDELPELELPDPLTGEPVSTTQFEGERAVLLTFFYTNCPDGMCPALILRLRRSQEVAAAEGYDDDIAFLAMTFDPERDTAVELESYGVERGVDLEAGNWHYLRPDRYEDGAAVLTERFGLPLKKVDAEEYDHLEYVFPHYNLLLLVNERGIVERAYPNGATVEVARVVADVETVVTA